MIPLPPVSSLPDTLFPYPTLFRSRRESMDKQHAFAAESGAAAQRTYDIAMVAFQRGLTDYLNVLNAQSLLFKQQQVQQQVEAMRLSAHADLVTALGGGLEIGRAHV